MGDDTGTLPDTGGPALLLPAAGLLLATGLPPGSSWCDAVCKRTFSEEQPVPVPLLAPVEEEFHHLPYVVGYTYCD